MGARWCAADPGVVAPGARGRTSLTRSSLGMPVVPACRQRPPGAFGAACPAVTLPLSPCPVFLVLVGAARQLQDGGAVHGHRGSGRLGFQKGMGARWFAADPGSWLLGLAGKMDVVVNGRSPGGSREASYRAPYRAPSPNGVSVCDASDRGPQRGRAGPPTSVGSISST